MRYLLFTALVAHAGRKAGTVTSFSRYSDALTRSGVVWDQKTLDAWLADPQHVVPGNEMTFPGIQNAQQRADIIAFLQRASQPNSQTAEPNAANGWNGRHDEPRCPESEETR